MKAVNLLLLVALMSIISCGDDDNPYDSTIGYDQTMRNYMDAQGWQGIPTADGMYYVIDVEGSSEKPNSNSTVEVNYKGYYSDDVVFDSNNNVIFNLQGVIITCYSSINTADIYNTYIIFLQPPAC